MEHEEKQKWLRMLSCMPLASVSNWASTLGMSEDAVRRRLRLFDGQKLVTSEKIGMTEPKTERFWTMPRGVQVAYEIRHHHPTQTDMDRARRLDRDPRNALITEIFWDRWDRSHAHGPFGDKEAGTHLHPPATATRQMMENLIYRLQTVESVYRIAPSLLRTGGLQPSDRYAPPRRIDGITDFWWFQNGRLYDAGARYGDDVLVLFTYLGPQVTERQLREKLDRQYQGLIFEYDPPPGVRRPGWGWCGREKPPPFTPSAHVVIAEDRWAMNIASRVLPGAAIECLDGCRTGEWTWSPSFHGVVDRIRTWPKLDGLDKVREWFKKNDVAAIADLPSNRTFQKIGKFPGMSSTDLGTAKPGEMRKAPKCLANLCQDELVFEWRERWYLTKKGRTLMARLNRVSPKSIHKRFERYDGESFREHEHHHDDGVNSLVLSFEDMGVVVEPGWRGVVNFFHSTQVKPDAWVFVEDGPLGPGWHAIEYELSATSPRELRKKLRPYLVATRRSSPVPLLMVCAHDRAEANVWKVAASIPIMTCTVGSAKAGPLAGAGSVWSHLGRDVQLLFGC